MTSTAVSPASVGVQVEDFFSCSWGYDQTNVDFFKVVGLTPKGVKVQEWSSALAASQPGGCYADSLVPGSKPKTYVDWSACTPEMDFWDRKQAQVTRPVKVQTKRLYSGYKGTGAFTVNSYSSAYKWDRQPQSQTAAGYGH